MSESDLRPDRGARVSVRITRVGHGQTLYILSLSDHYQGLFTHWKDPHSVYCPDDGTCYWRKCQEEQIWKGYTPVLFWNTSTANWLPTVLEISEKLELDLRGKWKRGQEWVLTRAQELDRKKKPVRGRLAVVQRPSENLPEEFDILPVLSAVFRVAHVKLGKQNPLPMPQTMLPFESAAPKALRPDDQAPASPEVLQKLRETLVGGFKLPNDPKNGRKP
jgi:hypothetical protein